VSSRRGRKTGASVDIAKSLHVPASHAIKLAWLATDDDRRQRERENNGQRQVIAGQRPLPLDISRVLRPLYSGTFDGGKCASVCSHFHMLVASALTFGTRFFLRPMRLRAGRNGLTEGGGRRSLSALRGHALAREATFKSFTAAVASLAPRMIFTLSSLFRRSTRSPSAPTSTCCGRSLA